MQNRITKKLLIPVIALLMVLPWMNKLVEFIPNPNLENRAFAKFPNLKLKNLDHYPLQLDSFISDNFSLRAASMQTYGRLNLYGFQKSAIPRYVYFGKEGWMFFTGNELATFDGSAYFTSGQTDSIITKLKYRKQYLKERGIDYYLVVLPVKNMIYADKQSDALRALRKKNRTDFFVENVSKAIPELALIDIRDDLLEARKIEPWSPLSFKTDNHWNRLGAFHGATAVLKGLKEHGANVKVPDYFDYKKDSTKDFCGNLAFFAGLQGVVSEWDYTLRPNNPHLAKPIENIPCEVPVFANSWEYQMHYQNQDTTLDKVLFIRDSFGSSMVEILAEGCGESLYIFDEWKYGLNKDWIKKYKPKIMVQLVLEKHLEHLLFHTPYPEG